MEDTNPGATPTNSQCCMAAEVKNCESLLHRIRTIQGKTNLNLAEPHFAGGNDEARSGRHPVAAAAAADFRKRIRRQQEILEKCRRKVADQLDQLYNAKKLLKNKRGGENCYETGDNNEVGAKNQVKLSEIFGDGTPKKARKISRAEKQEEDVTLTESHAVTCLKTAGEEPKPEAQEHLKNIVNSAIARLNKAKSSVQKVMTDNAEDDDTNKTKKSKRQHRPATEAQSKRLHGILKGKNVDVPQKQQAVPNSVAKEIDSAKKIARAQSARLSRKPRRLLKKRTKSTGCLLATPQENNPPAPPDDDEEDVDEKIEEEDASKDVRVRIAKNTNRTLSNLNEQMSGTLQESIAHLNELCMRVRNCLTEIEADELNYQKQKRRRKRVVEPSECDDGDGGGEREKPYQVEELQYIPNNSDQSFKISDEPSVETTIEQVITTISLGNGEIRMDLPKAQATPPATPPAENPQKKKRRRRAVKKQDASLTKLPSAGKIDCTPASTSKLPVWQRQLPSIIEEIQQTVKKQATRTQYKEFLKTLKHLARRDKSVLPQQNIGTGEVQQVSPPPKSEKTKQPKQAVYQRLKDMKNAALEVTGMSEAKKSCARCSRERCACGVKVENLCPTDSLSARQKLQWIKTRSDMGSNAFQTYDILDEITPKDVEPIQSEYPRKDHVPSTTNMKKVEDTLLYRLVYNRNPKLLETFLQSSSFIEDALKQRDDRRRSVEKSTSERHVTTINKVEPKLRPKSASNAYRLYEKLEFDRDIAPPPEKATPTDLTKEIQVVKAPRAKPKPKKIDAPCSVRSVKCKSVKPRPERTAEERLRLINKRSSAKSMSKKEVGAKLRPLLQNQNFKMKKILTIAPTLVDQRQQITKSAKEAIKSKLRRYMADPKKIFLAYPVQVRYEYQKTDGRQKTVKISRNTSEEASVGVTASQKGALQSMTKRDVIRRLKPYIFMNLAPVTELTVMPVSAKYNAKAQSEPHQHARTGHRASENAAKLKKAPWFPKDHGDDCHTGKKLCKKCIQFGADQARRAEEFTVMTHMEQNYLPRDRRLYRSANNNNRKTGEHMVSVVVKNNQPPQAKQNATRYTKQEATTSSCKNAANTCSKLKEVKKNAPMGQDLREIIDTIEFKIVDVLSSDPRNDRGGALRHIEDEIKCVLEMVTASPKKPCRAKTATTPKILLSPRDDSPPAQKRGAHDKMICIYAKGPSENSLRITAPEKETETPPESEPPKLTNVVELDNSIGSDFDLEVAACEKSVVSEQPIAERDVKSGDSRPAEYCALEDDDDLSARYDCENLVDNFCKQVDTVIKKITMSEESLAQRQQASEGGEAAVQVDEYLTPYMRAIKDYRRAANRTRSFVDFLDELSRLSQEETAVHYHPRHAMRRASVEGVSETRELIRRIRRSSTEEVKNVLVLCPPPSTSEKKKRTKNRRLQTLQLDYEDYEDYSKNQDVQTKEEEPIDEATQHVSKDLQRQSFSWSLLSESSESLPPEIPELVETKTKNENTQIPSGVDHRCFASSENQLVQVSDDLRRLCTLTVESQVSELRFEGVGVGTESKPPGLDKTCSNLSAATSEEEGSYERIEDFVCCATPTRKSGGVSDEFSTEDDEEVVSIFGATDNFEDATIYTERTGTKLYGAQEDDASDLGTAHKRLLGSVYGVVFTVVFLGLNMQYSC